MNPDHLYELLPTIYRMRDAEQGYPLQALLRVITEQAQLVEQDIAQLYENWFIETAQDWVVPYIGELIGYRPVHESGEPGDVSTTQGQARNKILIPRREVANTLAYRRRKGTLALLEILANEVSGWPARVVEFYKLLGWTQNLNFQHPDRGQTVDLHNGDALDLLKGSFDKIARTVDMRRINSTLTRGRYNIPSVGVFIPRLKAYSITYTQAYCLEESGPHCYTFSALGNDTPLYIKPEREADPTHIAEELNLPIPIRRRALEKDLMRAGKDPNYTSQYYGENKSLAIWARDWPTQDASQPIPPSAIIVADLTDWQYRPPLDHIAVDPVMGRIAFPPDQRPRRDPRPQMRRLRGVRVTYHYGFSAEMGGGEYERPLQQPARVQVFRVEEAAQLEKALAPWRSDTPEFEQQPHDAVIEIIKSGVYVLPFDITLKPDYSLQLRAANRVRPVIRLLDYEAGFPDSLLVTIGPGSRFTLDGLLITGRPVHVQASEEMRTQSAAIQAMLTGRPPVPKAGSPSAGPDAFLAGTVCPAEVVIRHCTLVPGWGIGPKCEPMRPAEPSLELYKVRAQVRIEHSIIGSIEVNEDEVRAEPIPIQISDTILDATSGEREALGAPGRPGAHAILTVGRSTVFGIVQVHAIELAENSIFNDCLNVARRQLGCMRFCYVPPECRTPRRYHCQPDLVVQAVQRTISDPEEQAEAKVREQERVRPRFTNHRYGNPGYGQLALYCAREIRRGAEDESEMGAFHDLYQPQREANLRARLDEYTPAGTNVGIIFIS
jgi:hypothetical protein